MSAQIKQYLASDVEHYTRAVYEIKTWIIGFSLALAIVLPGCSTIQPDWHRAERKGTIPEYELFVRKHPDSEQADIAKTKIEKLHFKQATSSKSIAGYAAYLKHYPDGSAADNFKILLRELRYEEAKKSWTVEAVNSFLSIYTIGDDADTLKKELPGIKLLEEAWEQTRRTNTVGSYNDFLVAYPYGYFAKEAKARIQIFEFNSAMSISTEFSDKQVSDYVHLLESETYATRVKKPLIYYVIKGNSCRGKMSKRKVLINKSPNLKACVLNLKAGAVSIKPTYITEPHASSVKHALFMDKYRPQMSHNGCSGPGLEIKVSSWEHRRTFSKFLQTFSIPFETVIGAFDTYLIADLLWQSDEAGRSYPHNGARRRVSSKEMGEPITYTIEGVEGIPKIKISTYKQALALKTYLKVKLSGERTSATALQDQ